MPVAMYIKQWRAIFICPSCHFLLPFIYFAVRAAFFESCPWLLANMLFYSVPFPGKIESSSTSPVFHGKKLCILASPEPSHLPTG